MEILIFLVTTLKPQQVSRVMISYSIIVVQAVDLINYFPSTIISYPVPLIINNQGNFEVPVGANATAIQKLIDEALCLKGNKPVIHFPYGEFLIDKPLKIPAGSDMQLVGEGLIEASVLKKVKGSFRALPYNYNCWSNPGPDKRSVCCR
ncbi:MAG: hypothetical protein IPP79_09645 [Chitinophagaceae bacterium]|nr:hypothetical protein [Chitinophagaceae bacterium]